MRPVNLRSIVVADKGLPTDLRDNLYYTWGITLKPDEITSLSVFFSELYNLKQYEIEDITRVVGNCYWGFEIPRISKEFDCLWISDNTVVNIELKSQDVGAEKIAKQLLKNRYYLGHLNRRIVSYTFDASSKRCYTIGINNNLVDVEINDIAKSLFEIHRDGVYVEPIEVLFPPEDYLVSPFNSTQEFMNGNYFLTDQQQKFKNKINQFVDNPDIGHYCAITGGPGSGKTLLLYDIAKTFKQTGKRILIGHAGGLNQGHRMLIENDWDIRETKNFFIHKDGEVNLFDADVYLIDEAQRCYNLDQITREIANTGKKCILSYDAGQVMSDREERKDNTTKIQSLVGTFCYRLSSNIRTNAAVYEFVDALFDIHHSVNKVISDNVEITYCRDEGEALTMLSVLKMQGYKVPKFTPRLHGKEDYESWFPVDELSAHQVIGQEFDYIASLLSEKMYYNEKGKLVSRARYIYREDKMLYQILTRARHKIHLVIVNNPALLNRCLKLIMKNLEVKN